MRHEGMTAFDVSALVVAFFGFIGNLETASGNAVVNHHITVNPRIVSLYNKLTGFKSDVIGSLDHHGFDAPEVPADRVWLVFKPDTIVIFGHAAVLRI